MPDQAGERLVVALVAEAVKQARELAVWAGRPCCAQLQAALAAARLRYMALCHTTVADRLMAEAGRLDERLAQGALAA